MDKNATRDQIDHGIAKVVELIQSGRDDRRAVLQLGYNLGRLSELTGLGREPFWDRWKGPIAAWDQTALQELARELHLVCSPARSSDHD
jgi:hypothetical protein